MISRKTVDSERVVVDITEFGGKPDSGEDTVKAVQSALEAVSHLDGLVILAFPKGRYDFYPQHAARIPYYISNTATEEENEDVTKTIGILFRNMKNIIVEGNGSLFMFHGKQTMIVLDQCENIEIRNVNTDFAHPTMAEMTVKASGNDYIDVKVHPTSRYEIQDGKLFWIGEGWRFHSGPMQEYDPLTHTTWRCANWIANAVRVEEQEPCRLRLYYDALPATVAGRVLQVRDGIRDQVGVFIHKSIKIAWNNVGMHYMHGLGMVGQFSENLTFNEMKLAPRPESGRKAAAFADFMHFSGCRGTIAVTNSHLEGAHDDAINVHGTHLRILEKRAPHQLLVKFMHGQSYGFEAFFPRDMIEFIRIGSLTTYASGMVKSAEFISTREILLTLEQTLPETIEADDVIENVTWTPEVEIRNNHFAAIPTRGILISTRRKVSIVGNVFERTAMSAVLIANDAESWYESGMVKDVTIRDNRFIECGNSENPVILIAPENRVVEADVPVHTNIHIENNVFQTLDAPVLAAKSTRDLRFINNEITALCAQQQMGASMIRLTACSEVTITGNTLNGEHMKMNSDLKLPDERHDLLFRGPIQRWDEALPLGNGLTGCLVWGGDSNSSPIKFSLDRGDLWDTRLATEVLDPNFTYSHLVELVRNQNQSEISRRFSDFFSSHPNPTKLPAGRIELNGVYATETIAFKLNVLEAKAEVSWPNDGATTHSKLESYLHAESGLGYIRLQGDAVNQVSLQLVPPDYTGKLNERTDIHSSFEISLASLGYPAAEFGSDEGTQWFLQRTSHGLAYAIVVAKLQQTDQDIQWVYTVASNLDGDDWFEEGKSRVRKALQSGFEEALHVHTGWWDRYWQQSALTLSDFEMEKMWYLTNYLFGSCSRKGAPPMPLQGVWTADEGLLPPWKGDYHHDLNTELSYWHYLKANHLQEGESFIDFLWDLRPTAHEFATSFFGTAGINLPSVMTIDGKPLGGWPMYSLSPTNQIWLCQAFDHYWLYTGDRDFLEAKAYVYLKETAACMLDLLQPDEEGKLYLPLSSSPEIHDDSLRSWLTPNSNYDLSLLRYLFARLEQMANLLGKDLEREQWVSVLASLPELAIDESGLMISPDERLPESHRHFSHAMAIYPLQTLDYRGSVRDKQIIDDTISHLEKLGKGLWVGYSFAWMAALYTRQGNGGAARYQLGQFWQYMCSPNGFHLNGDYKNAGITQFHYRPFTLEGNMAAADALQEMLLQTNNGVIRPFPAVPKEWWTNGAEFHQFRGEMGVLVSGRIAAGQLDYVELFAEKCDGIYKVENRFNSEKLVMEHNGTIIEITCEIGSELTVRLCKGETCTISPVKYHNS